MSTSATAQSGVQVLAVEGELVTATAGQFRAVAKRLLERAEGRLLGVAVPEPSTEAMDLKALHGRGVRGIRCNLLNPGGLDPDTVLMWQPALQELGWHVEFHIDVDRMGDLQAFLDPFEVPVVIEVGRKDGTRIAADRIGLVEC